MRDLGYVEGRDLIVEVRYAGRDYARFPALVEELLRARVDLIVTGGPASQAARSCFSAAGELAAAIASAVILSTAACGTPGRAKSPTMVARSKFDITSETAGTSGAWNQRPSQFCANSLTFLLSAAPANDG
jgi:hypothetical protein